MFIATSRDPGGEKTIRLLLLGLILCSVTPLYAQEKPSPPDTAAKKALIERLDRVHQQLQQKERKIRPALLRLSLEREVKRLKDLLGWRRLKCNPASEVARLERDLKWALADDPPYLLAGTHRLWYRSRLDGKPHPFVVAVPRKYKARRPYPLVVMLHGSGSSPMVAVGRLMGVPDDELLKGRERCRRPRVPPGLTEAIIVAPNAFGNARYRGAGGEDVRHVLAQVKKLYKVDDQRITITGLSMGGTGAAEVALHNPRVYAGVVALCGYFDRRLDRSTKDKEKLPWEKLRMSVYSPADWAENGRYLPLWLIHGTRDGPARARAMHSAYEKHGYTVSTKLHRVGHDVWTPGYKDGRVIKMLAQLRKVVAPRIDTFTTGRVRINRSHWITVERFADHNLWARVRAEVVSRRVVRVSTHNVVGLTLDLPAVHLSNDTPVRLMLDGQKLVLPASRINKVTAWRGRCSNEWALGTRPPETGLVKKAGLSGPMDDIYHEPILVVFGTGGGQRRLLYRVARRMRRLHRRATMSYPVISDKRYLEAARRRGRRWSRYRGRGLILVGNEQTNSVLARMAPRLPIRVTSDGVRMGKQILSSPNVGARFIYPNPLDPKNYVMVVAGTTERSYKLARKLPSYLPDYVVFDEGIDIKPFSPVVGKHRSLVKAGTFDEQWQLKQGP